MAPWVGNFAPNAQPLPTPTASAILKLMSARIVSFLLGAR
jgi:hypothetical protein